MNSTSPSPSQASAVAFLGIGLMGKPMSMRLLQARHAVHAWNRTLERARELETAGARLHADPASAVRGSDEGPAPDIVISMLADGATVLQVIEQALPGLREGMLWIDMSSTLQSEAKIFAQRLDERGVAFVDAPVSGGVLGAEAGTLAIMAGGSPEDCRRAEPVLSVLGRPVRVGPVGSGQLAKLCNQLIVGGTINIVAEALLLAQAGGADPAAVRSAIRGGFAESRILDVHGLRMLERNFMPGGKVATQTKDMDNILKTAKESGVHLPLTTVVGEQYHRIVGSIPMADHSAALIALERMNGSVRLGSGPDKLPEEG